MNTDLWLGRARESITRIPVGTRFVVKDLFEGLVWNTELTKGERLQFGRIFKNEVESGKFTGVRSLGRGNKGNGANEYVKE